MGPSSSLSRNEVVQLGENLGLGSPNQPPSTESTKKISYLEANPNFALALKVLTVAIVIAGLVTATIFTFGAAIPLVAGITAGSSVLSSAGAFAVFGTGVGLALSSVFTVGVAVKTKMYKVTKDNLSDIQRFLAISAVGSAVITGFFAAAGAGLGVDGVVAAKAGLSTLGASVILGSGAAVVKTYIDRDKR